MKYVFLSWLLVAFAPAPGSSLLFQVSSLPLSTVSSPPSIFRTPPADSLVNDSLPAPATLFSLPDSLIGFARKYMGVRYRTGGTTKSGFDCSGFTAYVYARFGFKLPHSSASQSLLGPKVAPADVQKGDLIFFKGSNRRYKRVGHVGIVISEKGQPVRFIHASHRGVTIDALQGSSYYRPRLLKIVRLLDFTAKAEQ